MQTLPSEQYQSWLKTAEILERDRHSEKVLRLTDGTILKMFRRKRWLSKAMFFPPASRFARNAVALKAHGIPAPEVIATYKLRNPERSVVHYHPLPGETLRDLARNQAMLPAHIDQLDSFIRHLHDLGIYFRSLHLGNILLLPDGEFGLIDISDLRCTGKPLSRWMRQRNMRHLMRYTKDWSLIGNEARRRFEQLYQS